MAADFRASRACVANCVPRSPPRSSLHLMYPVRGCCPVRCPSPSTCLPDQAALPPDQLASGSWKSPQSNQGHGGAPRTGGSTALCRNRKFSSGAMEETVGVVRGRRAPPATELWRRVAGWQSGSADTGPKYDARSAIGRQRRPPVVLK